MSGATSSMLPRSGVPHVFLNRNNGGHGHGPVSIQRERLRPASGRQRVSNDALLETGDFSLRRAQYHHSDGAHKIQASYEASALPCIQFLESVLVAPFPRGTRTKTVSSIDIFSNIRCAPRDMYHGQDDGSPIPKRS